MEQKKQWIAVLICLVLFVSGCLLSNVFSQTDSSEWKPSEGGQIVISEILASNRTYPAPDGQLLDFVEIHNLAANAVDISGFMLSDDLNSIGYTVPDGTVLPGYGYLVCWCSPNSDDDRYASFGISRKGGETIYLYNSANVLVDQKDVPSTAANTAIIRVDEATWMEAALATPGYPNTEEGYQLWLSTMTGSDLSVTITEVMTDNSCITAGTADQPWDWVELTNTGDTAADLSGAYLSNDPADPLKWQIPDLSLAPGEAAVVYCAGSGAGADCAPFGLSKTGCTVTLTGKLGNTLSQVICPPLETDRTWALAPDGSYQIMEMATPGFENTQEGFSAWLSSVGAAELQVTVTEIMTSNRSTVLGSAGTLCDWVELTNTGSTAVTLDNAYLSDDPDQRGKWCIPGLTLAPGEATVILCAGSMAGEGEADFALSSGGCTVTLSGSAGNIISQVEVPTLDNDRTWALQADGTYLQTDMPTPGYANTEENYYAYRATQSPLCALAITEVMPSNSKYLLQSDGHYYDWVELTNVSDEPIDLSGYSLSNDAGDLSAFPLPQQALAPGEQIVIICSATDTLAGSDIHAPFTLSAEECWVYVSDSDGQLCDYLRVTNVPDGCSMGRTDGENGTFYFEQPTPGKPNGTGVALISEIPAALTLPGVYNDVSSLSVELQGSGTLHYTTDGSVPTAEDPIYSSPIPLTSTTVLRVVSLEQGKLPSDTLTAAYIIGENHALPVLSLTVDPNAMFDADGIYYQSLPNDDEIACSLSLFEENGSFTLDCGVEMMATNTAYPEKKSLKVNFRGRYGSDVLGYPVFGADGPYVFDALCIQANSEHGLTLFRDELFAELCLQMTDAVPAQHYKFCVLYINGAYYGIYSLKEDIGQMLYSQSMSVAEADVTMVTEPGQWGSDLHALAQYCDENDMSDQSCFDYLASQVDIDNVIDWMILQGYCCNESIANDLCYFRTPETGSKWQLGFFDLDGGFTSRTGFKTVLTDSEPYQYLRLTRSIASNPDSRQQLLVRLSEALNTTLDKDNVLSLIDRFEALLAPEIQRERARWGGDAATWQADVDRLKAYLTRYDHPAMLVQSLREHMALTDEEAAQYFGR